MKIDESINKRLLKVVDTAIAEEWHGIDTQKSFAEYCNIDPGRISHIRQGIRNASPDIIHLVCKKLNINANYIIIGTLPMKNESDDSQEKINLIRKIVSE